MFPVTSSIARKTYTFTFTMKELNISRIDNNSLNYSCFFNEYLIKNKPCVLYNATKDWTAYNEWADHVNNIPNFEFLNAKYGDLEVPTVKCTRSDEDDGAKNCIIFRDFLKYWQNNTNEYPSKSIYYLKDWHLKKHRPDDHFYKVPEYFSSDWLNEYSSENGIDDYMFVYMGPKGSWTPFHVDVFKSFSWSANIIGKKRWLLFPPGEENKFMDSLGNFPKDVECMIDDNIKYYEIFQYPAEVMFVPSGWYHQVSNEEHTISINHNWINRCNISTVWNFLMENLNAVEIEIGEFKRTEGWHEHCQLMLRALFGMNLVDFVNFVCYICDKRVQSLKKGLDGVFQFTQYRKRHICKDLKSLREIFNCIIDQVKNRNLDHVVSLCNVYRKIEITNKYL